MAFFHSGKCNINKNKNKQKRPFRSWWLFPDFSMEWVAGKEVEEHLISKLPLSVPSCVDLTRLPTTPWTRFRAPFRPSNWSLQLPLLLGTPHRRHPHPANRSIITSDPGGRAHLLSTSLSLPARVPFPPPLSAGRVRPGAPPWISPMLHPSTLNLRPRSSSRSSITGEPPPVTPRLS